MKLDNKVFQDKTLTCCDCGSVFLFSSGEQAFFHSKRLSEPRRCPECRRVRRERLVPDPEAHNG